MTTSYAEPTIVCPFEWCVEHAAGDNVMHYGKTHRLPAGSTAQLYLATGYDGTADEPVQVQLLVDAYGAMSAAEAAQVGQALAGLGGPRFRALPAAEESAA